MKIKCDQDGKNKCSKKSCTEDIMKKRMTETKIVGVEDFHEGVKFIACRCKACGTDVERSGKIIVEKACEYFNV